MSDRVIILSDTHLGRPHGAALSAEALRPLWAGASQVILNGDVAEVHHPAYCGRAARDAIHLFDLCDRDAVQLTLISGNHDPYLTDRRHVALAGGDVLVTHGDVLHPAVAPWSPAAGRMRRTHRRAMDALDTDDRHRLEQLLWASQRASTAEWDAMEVEASRSSVRGMMMRPWAIAQVLWYWTVIPGLAARFAATHVPDARFVVIGHTHRPGIWRRRGRTVINTGSYGFPGHPRAVVLEGDELSVWRVRLVGDHYELGSSPIRVFDLRREERTAEGRSPLPAGPLPR